MIVIIIIIISSINLYFAILIEHVNGHKQSYYGKKTVLKSEFQGLRKNNVIYVNV
jgi:hypothetical protein